MLGVLLAPGLALLALIHDGDLHSTLSVTRSVLVACGGLLAVGLLIGHARLAGNEQSMWLASAFGVMALACLLRGGYRLIHPDETRFQHPTILLAVVGINFALLLMLVRARREPRGLNALAVALPMAMTLLVAQQIILNGGPSVVAPMTVGLSVVLCCSLLGFAVAVRWLDALPRWARDRLCVALVFGAISNVLLLTELPLDPGHRAIVAATLGLAEAILLATTAAALLREVMTDGQRQLRELQRQLAAVEADRRADSARLHDINSLVAGIASASRLIRDLPPSDHRDGLEVLVLAELDRLQRLLADRQAGRRHKTPERPAGAPDEHLSPRGTDHVFDAGAVASRIALAHRARGRDVRWDVVEARVNGNPDDLAQLLDILIDNAAFHGTPDDIALDVRHTSAGVEVSVSDSGPGIPPELRPSLFSWGARGPLSNGSGIGLASATMLATELGGRLELDPSWPGTRMVLTLPALTPATSPEELAVAV